jgi:tetratricopeptide (TPR) repeat protein
MEPSLREIYFKSQARYIEYYLEIRKHTNDVTEEAIKAELANLQQAFQLSLQTDSSLPPKFWEALSGFLYQHGYWQNYLEWGEHTLEILQQNNLPQAEAWLLSEIGWLRMDQGEYELSKPLLDQAERIFEALDDWKGTATLQRYQGVLAYRTGNLDHALECYEQASHSAMAHQSWLMLSEIRNLQGSLARRKGEVAKARQLYEESVTLVEQTGDKWRLTAVIRNQARLDVQLGDLETAKTRFESAIELCKQVDRKDMLYGCQLGLAEVEQKLRRLSEARALALAARNGFIELEMKKDVEEANRLLSTLDD